MYNMVNSTTQFPTSLKSYVCRHNPALRDSISVRGQHYDLGKVAYCPCSKLPVLGNPIPLLPHYYANYKPLFLSTITIQCIEFTPRLH